MDMNDIMRRLDDLEAAPIELESISDHDDLTLLRTGWGKIVYLVQEDADNGKYALTEYVYNHATNDWDEAAHPPGYERATAYEIHGRTDLEEDDLVQFWEASVAQGQLALFFEKVESGTTILWGQVTSDTWTDNRPAAVCTVEVYSCDNSDGDNVDLTTVHTVKAPVPDGQDPLYFEDDILPYIVDPELDPTEYVGIDVRFDEEIGQFKWWHDIAGIPTGWQLSDGTSGTVDRGARFLVAYKSGDADFGTEEGTGGSKTHAHSIAAYGGGSGVASGTDLACYTSTDKVLPPYIVQGIIERTS